MTSPTAMPALQGATAGEREEFLAALTQMRDFYQVHPDAPLPGGLVLNIRVPGTGYGQRIAALRRIAAALGVTMTERDGVQYAERQFGPVTIEAHVSPPDFTVSGYYARTGAAA